MIEDELPHAVPFEIHGTGRNGVTLFLNDNDSLSMNPATRLVDGCFQVLVLRFVPYMQNF